MGFNPYQSSNNLIEKFGNIVAEIEFPYGKHDLMTYVKQHGSLYTGTLIPTEFQKIFNFDKNYILKTIGKIKNSSEITPNIQRVWFYLHLIRECIKNSWRWPAIANEINGQLYFYAGLGRLSATAMCQPDPWKKLNVLLYCPNNTSNTHKLFDNLQLINTDKELHQALNLKYPTEHNHHGASELQLSFRHENDHSLILTQMYDGNSVHHYQAGIEYLEDLLAWKNIYGERPTLKVYTNWPEKIVDSQQCWKIVHAGPSPGIKISENLLYNQFNNLTVTEHMFYATTSRTIDVSELLGWVNLKFTSYISLNWEFALLTPGKEYRSFLFDLSYI
jgi:hypothetical protein